MNKRRRFKAKRRRAMRRLWFNFVQACPRAMSLTIDVSTGGSMTFAWNSGAPEDGRT